MRDRLCNAPFNSLLIDPNKGVRPCCEWKGGYFGNLQTETLEEIYNNPIRRQLQQDMNNNVWHYGCSGCKHREEETGRSPRLDQPITFNKEEKITYLEYNSSNTCNLSCVMCGPQWSSAWTEYNKKYNVKNVWVVTDSTKSKLPPEMMLPSDSDFVNKFIKTDFTSLETIMFKGGEPFLNKENLILLEHLDKIDRLKDIEIIVNTNATIINKSMLDYMAKSRRVGFIVSVDGFGDINRWIRWGNSTPDVSTNENILNNIKIFTQLSNLDWITNTFCVQAYNIFRLEEHIFWWHNVVMPMHKNIKRLIFNHIVNDDVVGVRLLTDKTRFYLADRYEKLNPAIYSAVVNYLRMSYMGNSAHNKFVDYTMKLDATRDRSIKDIVPELKNELVHL